MTGSGRNWLGCSGGFVAGPPQRRRGQRELHEVRPAVGLGVYWFMGGPGVDPHYNGSTTEAYAWGQRRRPGGCGRQRQPVKYRVLS